MRDLYAPTAAASWWNPGLPAQSFRSFGMTVTAYTRATCEDVDCSHWRNGWLCSVEAGSADERLIAQACDGSADGIRRQWASREQQGTSAAYWFPPGQPCFRASTHRIPEQGRFYHRDGDRRGNPSGLIVTHSGPESWRDELGEHQLRLAGQRERYGAG